MIPGIEQKCASLVNIINSRIHRIDVIYRHGPSLYFYSKTINLRRNTPKVDKFLRNDTNIELLYATLVSWDMNSRGAKMKDFIDFKSNIHDNIDAFKALEKKSGSILTTDLKDIKELLSLLYNGLSLMVSNQRLVSNSKLLHFIFPDLLMPMDSKNTLTFCYGNTSESIHKYFEVVDLSFRIAQEDIDWNSIVTDDDNLWNRSIPKVIDNAILIRND